LAKLLLPLNQKISAMKIALRVVFPLLACLIFLNAAHAQTLRGTVRDADNGSPVQGATVALRFSRGEAAPVSVATSPAGEFAFEKIRPGYYRLEIVAQGFENQTIVEIAATAGKEQVLDIALRRANSQLGEVTILAAASGRRAPLPLGEIPLTRDQTLRFPAMFFDPARLAAAYPGVAQTDDGINGLSIRGNSPASVRWRLEGVDVVNPNHLPNAGTFSDRPAAASGGILMFSAQLLDNSSLLTGALPAGYGDALGGVMDMNLRRGNGRQAEFTAQTSLVGLDLAAEGPLGNGASESSPKASYLVNYRYSTVGLLGQLGVSFGDEQINFQDLSFNINLEGKKGARWSVFGLGGLSENVFRRKADTLEVKQYKAFFDIDFYSKTGIVGASHWRPTGRNGWMKIAAAYSAQTNERSAVAENFPLREAYDEADESKFSFSATFSQRLAAQIVLTAGGVATQRGARNASATPLMGAAVKTDYWLAQPWANVAWGSRDARTVANVGLHNTWASLDANPLVEPRLSLSHALAQRHRLAILVGQYSQVSALPWVQDLQIIRAWQAGLRYTWSATEAWVFRSELFWQRQNDVGVEAQNASAFSLLNLSEFSTLEQKALIYNGLGESRGLELSAERRLSSGWFMLANGTLLDARYRGSDRVWRASRWDLRHLANVAFGKEWQREKRPGKERIVGLNARAVWTGGFREMPIDVAASEAAQATVFDADAGFSEQLPDYFRLDVRVYWRKNLDNRRNSTFALDLQNLTGQENVAYRFYDPFTRQVERKLQLGTIPNFSWRVEF
jgi:hypothetical protein